MKIRTISVVLLLLFTLSSLSTCTPPVSAYHLDSHQNITVNISEGLGMNDNGMSSGQQSDSISSDHKITLNGNTPSLPSNSYQSTIVVRQNSNTQTTLDNIWNADRLRFNGRTFVSDKIPDEQTGKLSALDDKRSDPPVQTGTANIISQLDMMPRQALLQFYVLIDNHPGMYNIIQNGITVADGMNHAKYSALVLLVPLVGYVIVRQRVQLSSKFLSFFVLIVSLLPFRFKCNGFVSLYESLGVAGAGIW